MKKIRVVKVIVQPVVVADDGKTLTELDIGPATVPPEAWPDYATTGFVEQLAAIEKQINAEAADGNGQPANREQRRAAAKRTRAKTGGKR
jgi:hypothetical protein